MFFIVNPHHGWEYLGFKVFQNITWGGFCAPVGRILPRFTLGLVFDEERAHLGKKPPPLRLLRRLTRGLGNASSGMFHPKDMARSGFEVLNSLPQAHSNRVWSAVNVVPPAVLPRKRFIEFNLTVAFLTVSS